MKNDQYKNRYSGSYSFQIMYIIDINLFKMKGGNQLTNDKPIIRFAVINNIISSIEEIEFEKNLFVIQHDNCMNDNFKKRIGKELENQLNNYLGNFDQKPHGSELIPLQIGIDKIMRVARITNFGVLYKYDSKKNKNIEAKDSSRKIAAIISAFRVYKNIYISLYPLITFGDTTISSAGFIESLPANRIEPYYYSFMYPYSSIENKGIVEYKLETKGEVSDLLELYKRIERNRQVNLDIAIGRMNSAYLRDSEVDILIDIIIGLESMIGRGISSELTYRLSNRVAFLMSDIRSEREKYFALVKDAYEIRSRIAHGDIQKLENAKVVKNKYDGDSRLLIITLLNFLRNVIRKILLDVDEDFYINESFFKNLDSSIIRGDSFDEFIKNFSQRIRES